MRADDESIESRVVVERIKRFQAARLRAERLVQVGEIRLGEDGAGVRLLLLLLLVAGLVLTGAAVRCSELAAEQRLRVLVGARLGRCSS